MIRVGIISMQKVPNYGSFLQAYALKQLLLKAGADSVDFLDIEKGRQFLPSNPSGRWYNHLKDVLSGKFISKMKTRSYLKIKHERFLPYYDYFRNDNPADMIYDLAVIGSDEVFNCCQPSLWGFSRQLFGDVENSRKAITYAASFGSTTKQKIEQYGLNAEIAECLEKLSAISVRDDNTFEIVKELTGKAPEKHLDPVLVYGYKAELERKVDGVVPQGDYMIVYSYAGRIDDKKEIRSITDFAKRSGLKLYSLFCNYDWCDGEIVPEHPLQVPAVFKGARYAVTDTFHGTIFSIISHTKFATLVRAGNVHKLSSLLDGVGLIDRIVKAPESLSSVIEKEINYNEVEQVLDNERLRTSGYLTQQLRGE